MLGGSGHRGPSTHVSGPRRNIAGQSHKLGQGDLPGHDLCYQPWLMDEALWEIARHHAYGSLGLDPDPELAFIGVRALRELADFCEGYQVRRLREAGHSWARIAAWAGVSPQAVHKKYAQAIKMTKEPSR